MRLSGLITLLQMALAIWLGRFKNEEDAARAYNTAALKLYGAFATLNVRITRAEEIPPGKNAAVKYRGTKVFWLSARFQLVTRKSNGV